jgi:hypothetical protein
MIDSVSGREPLRKQKGLLVFYHIHNFISESGKDKISIEGNRIVFESALFIQHEPIVKHRNRVVIARAGRAFSSAIRSVGLTAIDDHFIILKSSFKKDNTRIRQD